MGVIVSDFAGSQEFGLRGVLLSRSPSIHQLNLI
jgi:hypothetical protein